MVITELDKFPKLQKRILLEGLREFWEAPLRRAEGRHVYQADWFRLYKIFLDYFGVEPETLRRAYRGDRQARNELASPRAAASRALRQLIGRALVQRARDKEARERRKYWQLTLQGVAVARALFPQEKGDPELIPKLKEIYETRSGREKRLPPWEEFYALCTYDHNAGQKKSGSEHKQ
jgi:DNA-binding MarR family transcriptional regulator